MENLPSGNNSAAERAREGVPPGATGFSGQSVVEELRSLGLIVMLDEAQAMRIKGRLQIIEGRCNQGHYRSRWFVRSIDWDRLYAECYHAVARELVDVDMTPETLEETIPGFLSEYFRGRKRLYCDKRFAQIYCQGAALEWKGKLLRMAAERTSTLLQGQTEETVESKKARRAILLADYIKRTGASNREIYEGLSVICKPDFYKWRKGVLPTRSVTTQKFERFLRAGRRPVPRRPKL